MLANVIYRQIPLIAYDKKHCENLEKLIPLIAAPWFIGAHLFAKKQWVPTLNINSTGVDAYDITPNKNHIIACRYHANIIKSIYEILKELDVLTGETQHYRDIPTWLGLIISDIVTYKIHMICVDECLSLADIKIYSRNIKGMLIDKEKKKFYLTNLYIVIKNIILNILLT
ncbi:MAG: hypothetical protein HC907_32090 [Richelia sp. SM1_7_0]|nr:hypothetical protein [Richelia sp. SM1_7_0]